jgi:hypothetical protein
VFLESARPVETFLSFGLRYTIVSFFLAKLRGYKLRFKYRVCVPSHLTESLDDYSQTCLTSARVQNSLIVIHAFW